MATNYAKASYTEIIDLQTVNGKCSIVGIHTPTGLGPYLKLRGFFQAFRQYRYRGVSNLTMIPAAQLPVDPLGLTGVVGTTDLMDPRDMMNPIIAHGCHGERMDLIIDRFFSNHATGAYGSTLISNPSSGYISQSADMVEEDMSTAVSEARYYARLTDPTWRKFGIQSGVRMRHLRPLVWKLAQSMPLLPNASSPYNGQLLAVGGNSPSAATPVSPTTHVAPIGDLPTITAAGSEGWANERAYVQQFTNGVTRLGWLPTVSLTASSTASSPVLPSITTLPKLFMMMLVLPPSYNVEQFFRLSITHVFEFKGFTTCLGPMDSVDLPNLNGDGIDSTDVSTNKSYYNWIDYTDAGSKVVQSDPLFEGTSLDVLNGVAEVVSDGVN